MYASSDRKPVIDGPGQVQAIIPAGCDVDRESRLDEPLAKVVDGLAVILYE
jgi:hypothetical protein